MQHFVRSGAPGSLVHSAAAMLAFASLHAAAVRSAADDSSPADEDRPAAAARVEVPKAAGRVGVRPYSPQKWGILSVEAVNPTDREATLVVSSYLRDRPGRKFGRTLWVPAGATRVSWYPLFVSLDENLTSDQTEVISVVGERTGDAEQPLKDQAGRMRRTSPLPIGFDANATAVIVGSAEQRKDFDGSILSDAVAACRLEKVNSRRLSSFDREFLPATAEALDNLDQLVVYNDLLATDAAALTAVRRWVQRGGRLWIMADRVRPETVERLLGHAAPYREVDRVSLTEVRLLAVGDGLWASDRTAHQYDDPVDLVRVLLSDAEVAHTVDGWPASFWQDFGEGRILYTTLGMRGWLQTPPANDERFRKMGLRFAPARPLSSLMDEFYRFQSSSEQRSPTALFEDYLSQQIGYETVSRSTVLAVLGAFIAALLAGGVWLARTRRLERMRWVAPAAAFAGASVLLLMGTKSRTSVPDTVAVAQFVEVSPRSEDVGVSGLLATYHQSGSTEDMGVERGSALAPDFAERPGTARRMIWTDFDTWHWEDVDVPAGAHETPFTASVGLRQPVRAVGRFGPRGLEGTLQTATFRDPADAVIVTSSRDPGGVDLHEGGRFTAGPDQQLAAGQFVSGTLLSDEQRRRQEVYRKLLNSAGFHGKDGRPLMLVWTAPIDVGFRIGEEARHVGSALLAVPVQVQPTSPGTRVALPATFLSYRKTRDPEGGSFSSAYSNVKGEWIERTKAARTWLRIQLPPQVVPIRLDSATVTLHFNGPPRPVKIAGLIDGKETVLASAEQPVGKTRIPIDRAEALNVDAGGGLLLGVLVGGPAGDSAAPASGSEKGVRQWKLDYVRIDLAGTTAP